MERRNMNIPFNIPYTSQRIVSEAVLSIQADIFEISKRVEALEFKMKGILELKRVKKMYFTLSATHALEMMALALDFKSGDEVIMPSYTYVATANAFAKAGARIRFADIDPLTLNIDARTVEPLVNHKTRAIVLVHYAGYPCDLEALIRICKAHDIILLEDAAHAIGVQITSKTDAQVSLGTFGDMGCISFHATKNITSGGTGGVLFITDEKWISILDDIFNEGTNRSAFLKSEVNAYAWTAFGGVYQMNAFNMAFLCSALDDVVKVNANRIQICRRYREALERMDLDKYDVTLPQVDSPNGHVFYLLFQNQRKRDVFKNYLLKRGVHAHAHYEPLHQSFASEKYGFYETTLPVTESTAQGLIRLPVYDSLSEVAINYVIEVIETYFKENI